MLTSAPLDILEAVSSAIAVEGLLDRPTVVPFAGALDCARPSLEPRREPRDIVSVALEARSRSRSGEFRLPRLLLSSRFP